MSRTSAATAAVPVEEAAEVSPASPAPAAVADAPAAASAPSAAQAAQTRRTAAIRDRVQGILLGVGFPIALVILWHQLVVFTGTKLVPTPYQVGLMMYDFSFGGIHEDAFSGTIVTHLLASMERVYGGFFLAIVLGVPLGLLIGKVQVIRQLVDPTLSLLRPIPVTAWLPLSMIFFGLGPRSAIFLVFLGAFYPILLNTIFGVRSVDLKLFEAASMLGCDGSRTASHGS